MRLWLFLCMLSFGITLHSMDYEQGRLPSTMAEISSDACKTGCCCAACVALTTCCCGCTPCCCCASMACLEIAEFVKNAIECCRVPFVFLASLVVSVDEKKDDRYWE